MKDLSSLKQSSHYPVMLDQVLKICEPDKGGDFIDCTFGSGGYSNAILSFPKTKVTALDRDLETQEYVERTKKLYKDPFSFHSRKFSELNKIIETNKKFDFVIFDLGISSFQIFNLERGFSFNSKSRVDMRMGLNSISAHEVLNDFSLATLNDIFKFFGEEREVLILQKILLKREKSVQFHLHLIL